MKPFRVLIGLLVTYLIFPTLVYGSNPPSLLEPSNGSTTADTSPKLEWQYDGACSTSDKCFRVLVDNSSDFGSPEKDYYTNNTSYSPTLSTGIWNFKVKAKDETNSWTEYSSPFSFTVSDASSGGQTAVTDPTPAPDTTTTTTTTTSSNQFLISHVPSSIYSADSFNAGISITGLQPNSTYYLKGAFYKSGSTNYFGKTNVSGNWVKNSENYAKQYSFTADSGGSFNGEIKVVVDPDDSGFTGSGNYLFKIGRYNSSGSGPTWSNEVSIGITDNTPKEETVKQTKTTKAGATTSPTVLSKANSVAPIISKVSAAKAETKTKNANSQAKLPEIAGVSTSSAQNSPTQTTVAGTIKFNWWFIAGGILSLIASASSLVYMVKKR